MEGTTVAEQASSSEQTSSPSPGQQNISIYERFNLDPSKEILQLSALTPDHLENLVNVTREYPSEYATVVFGYAMPIVLLFSMVTNTLLIMVLNTNTFTGPVNQILLTLAKVDILTVAFPAPWYFYLYTLGFHNQHLYPPAACYIHHLMTDVIPVLFHTASIWLTSFLAFHRFLVVCTPNVRTRLSEGPGCVVAVRRILWFSFAHQFLRFFDSNFTSVYIERDGTYDLACMIETAGWVKFIGMSVYYGVYFMIRILFVSIIPCLILLVINCLLFRALRKAEIRMSKLTGFRVGGSLPEGSSGKSKRQRQTDCLKLTQANEKDFSTTDMKAQLVGHSNHSTTGVSNSKLGSKKGCEKGQGKNSLQLSNAFKFSRKRDKHKPAPVVEQRESATDSLNQKLSTTEEFSSDQFFRHSFDHKPAEPQTTSAQAGYAQCTCVERRQTLQQPSTATCSSAAGGQTSQIGEPSGAAVAQHSPPVGVALELNRSSQLEANTDCEIETNMYGANQNYVEPKIRKGIWATSSARAHFGRRINKCASYESRLKCSCQSTPCSLARTFWPSYPDKCSCTSSDCVDHKFRLRGDQVAEIDWTRGTYSKSESCVNCFKDDLEAFKVSPSRRAGEKPVGQNARVIEGNVIVEPTSTQPQASRSAGGPRVSSSANTTSTTLLTTSNNSTNTGQPVSSTQSQPQQHVRQAREVPQKSIEKTRSPSNVSTSMARKSKTSLTSPNPTVVVSRAGASACEARIRDNNRTTAMLIVMVTLFLMIEVPVAVVTIFHLVSNTYDVFHTEEFRSNVKSVKLFANSCIILSYSLNFFIYCIMSARFRMTLAQVAPFTRVIIGKAKSERATMLTNASRASQMYSVSCSNFNRPNELASQTTGRPGGSLVAATSSAQIAEELPECVL